MSKFHINKHGVPAPCHAKEGNCPLGGNEQHFDNIQEAQEYADKVNESSHGILPEIETKPKISKHIDAWKKGNPVGVKRFIETGFISESDDEFDNDNIFADGVSRSLENNFENDLYPEKREYINTKTKDLVRILQGDVKEGEENFIDSSSQERANKRAQDYYNTVMSEREIIAETLNNNYSPEELTSVDPDDYEVHPVPISTDKDELFGKHEFIIARKDGQAVVDNPIVNSQALFVGTYNNKPIDGKSYSSNHDLYNSATVSRLTTDMKQWRKDIVDDEYSDNEIIDKYGPALGRDVIPK